MVELTKKEKQSIDEMIEKRLPTSEIARTIGKPLGVVINYRIESMIQDEKTLKDSLIPKNYQIGADFEDLKSFLGYMKDAKPFPQNISCEYNRYVYLLKIMKEDPEGVTYNRIMGEVNKNEKILAMFEVSAEFYGTKKFKRELMDLQAKQLIIVRSPYIVPNRYALGECGRDLMNYLEKNCKKL